MLMILIIGHTRNYATLTGSVLSIGSPTTSVENLVQEAQETSRSHEINERDSKSTS